MEGPELVPDGFLGRLLREFGMEWTHVAVLTGVAFSSFGLDTYLHPGVWILGTMAGFTIAYLFRRQASPRFARTCLLATTAIALAVAIPGLATQALGYDIGALLTQYRILGTLYLSLAIIIPVAVAILSYRLQEVYFGADYPLELRKTIEETLAKNPFFRRDQIYRITISALDPARVTMDARLEYSVVNRTNTPQTYTCIWASPALSAQYREIKINGESIDVADPDYHTSRGVRVPVTLGPKGSATVAFAVTEIFSGSGTELLTSYAPCTRLTLELAADASKVAASVESLLSVKVPGSSENGKTVYRSPGAVLPFQGFRLYWKPAHTQSA